MRLGFEYEREKIFPNGVIHNPGTPARVDT